MKLDPAQINTGGKINFNHKCFQDSVDLYLHSLSSSWGEILHDKFIKGDPVTNQDFSSPINWIFHLYLKPVLFLRQLLWPKSKTRKSVWIKKIWGEFKFYIYQYSAFALFLPYLKSKHKVVRYKLNETKVAQILMQGKQLDFQVIIKDQCFLPLSTF